MSRLLVVTALPQSASARATRDFAARFLLPDDAPPTRLAELAEEEGAEALLISGRTRLDAATIAALPDPVRIVATCSVGVDHIDLVAAKRRGLIVTNTPDVLTNATAEMAMLLLLAASRRAADYFRLTASGWGRRLEFTEMLGMGLDGKTLGVVGMGRIGQAVAVRARSFGMKIQYHNRRRLSPAEEGEATYIATLEDLLSSSDAVSLNLPGDAGAPPLLTAERLALMAPGAILINTARGSLVDEAALAQALAANRLFAAGLDVFSKEPAIDPALSSLPNVFLTPHVGSATLETREAMAHRALDNIEAALAGRRARDDLTSL